MNWWFYFYLFLIERFWFVFRVYFLIFVIFILIKWGRINEELLLLNIRLYLWNNILNVFEYVIYIEYFFLFILFCILFFFFLVFCLYFFLVYCCFILFYFMFVLLWIFRGMYLFFFGLKLNLLFIMIRTRGDFITIWIFIFWFDSIWFMGYRSIND